MIFHNRDTGLSEVKIGRAPASFAFITCRCSRDSFKKSSQSFAVDGKIETRRTFSFLVAITRILPIYAANGSGNSVVS